jgi:hypothetical protein
MTQPIQPKIASVPNMKTISGTVVYSTRNQVSTPQMQDTISSPSKECDEIGPIFSSILLSYYIMNGLNWLAMSLLRQAD